MSLPTVPLGNVQVSRLIIGGNPFSGFSHQGRDRDGEMRHYYTAERIKEEFRRAEALGVNTHIGRADHHVMRLLMEYWDEGGKIQWFAQTCPELGLPLNGARNGINNGAVGGFIHGGQMDMLLQSNDAGPVREGVQAIRDAGLPVGCAGHCTEVFDWAEENVDLDFYMCCYYNPNQRASDGAHVHGSVETFDDETRDAMVARIATLSKPVIHYKVLAAGRLDPKEAFDFVAKHLRPQDAVCVGVFSKDRPDMLAENVRLLNEALAATSG